MTFEISDTVVRGVPVVVVRGELDVATAPELRAHLLDLTSPESPTIVVDLLDVSFLDSTALGVLVGAHRRCREVGGEVRLAIDNPHLMKVFEITGLTQIFAISTSVAGALEV